MKTIKMLVRSVVIGIVLCLLFGYVGDGEPRKMVALGAGLGICGWLVICLVWCIAEADRLDEARDRAAIAAEHASRQAAWSLHFAGKKKESQ